jgi:hypothetical protein
MGAATPPASAAPLRMLLPLAALLLASCSRAASTPAAQPVPSAPSPSAVTVRAVDHRFLMPTHWPSGWVTVSLRDDGGQPHQLQLARLRPGATLDEIRRDFAGRPAAAFAQLVLEGGPDTVEPGLGQDATLWLVPGAHVALDLSVGPDGVQNVNAGMLDPFTVDGPALTGEPAAQSTLVESSFSFEVPAISAGPVVIRVRNVSTEDPHEATIVEPAAGKGATDVLAYLKAPAGPPPFRFAGGMAGLEPGQTGFLDVDLDAGSYVLICLVTDPATGRFHFDEGMIRPFTVLAR